MHSFVMGTSIIQCILFSTLNEGKNHGTSDGGESVVSIRWELNLAH